MDKIKQLIDDTPKDFAEPNFRLCFKINQLQNGKFGCVRMNIPSKGGNPSHRPANFLKTKEVKDLIAEIDAQNYDVGNPTSKNTAVKIIGFNWSKKYRCGDFCSIIGVKSVETLIKQRNTASM